MLLQLIFVATVIIVGMAQETPKLRNQRPKQNEEPKPSVVYLRTPPPEFQNPNEIQYPLDIKHFNAGQQFSPELYGLTYLESQYQDDRSLPRLQPQIVLYSPRGQGQPILINPGNPPGNFLIPQGPGPNIFLRNNPQAPQGSLFPVAGYPKPAHIPPIEKDAEEIPTNPAKIPPLLSDEKPVTKPRAKPEKLETFNEPNQPDQNVNVKQEQFPQLGPETISLGHGQRFFILNGENIFGYPFEAQTQFQGNLPAFRYTNVQPFPQNPEKFLHPVDREPPQLLQKGEENTAPISIPKLLQDSSFKDSQHRELQPQQTKLQQSNQVKNGGVLKSAQQYFRTAFPVNQPTFSLYAQEYPVSQEAVATDFLNKNVEGIEGVQGITSQDGFIQPQLVGQFRFTPNAVGDLFPFKDDFENDAIVVDAPIDAPTNLKGRGGGLEASESESTTSKEQQPIKKESEPSMAQAAPQATAIAGPGGVAGSGPRGTAIVGKGGLAVSSPRATAVAGTKDEDKKKRPMQKNA